MSECEKLRVGKEFLASHKWPLDLCKTTHDRCYCIQCYKPSEPDTYSVGGHKYVIPRSWTRFGVYVDEPFAKHHNVWKTWANCYHGTGIENAKSIVEHRQLLLPRDMTLDGKKLQIREGHIPGEYYFFTTPTIRYAALDYYAHTYNFKSSTNNKRYKIKVVLQCKQKSDSFIVQPETVGARARREKLCPHVSNDEMEWKTQHRSAIMPYGLMLQIKNEGDDDDDDGNKDDKGNVNDNSHHSTSKPTNATQKINCPHCSQTNVWENGGFKEGKIVSCAYENCKKKFQQVTCPHCSGSISWKNADHKEEAVVTCPYESCKKKFQQITCAHCSRSIVWKNAGHSEDSVINCPYEDCKKTFQQLSCVHCSRSIVWKNASHLEDNVINCPYEGCKKTFQQLSCVYCSGSIIWKNAGHKEEDVISCPYEGCKKTFQQINCVHCSRSIVWKNANRKREDVISCPNEGCKKTFQQLNCAHCSRSIVWKNADRKKGNTITCPYEGCKKTFQRD